MIDPKKINKIIEDVIDSMPEGLKTLPDDIKQHLKASLNQALVKLDVVTREEFDVQVKVLEKTRAKLDDLAQKLRDLDDNK